jgi:hypothetical protein
LPLGAGADIGGAKSAPQKAFSHLLCLLYLTQVSIGGAKSSMAYSRGRRHKAEGIRQAYFTCLLYLLSLTQVSIGGAKSSMAYSILRKIARFQSAVHSASLRFFFVKKRIRLSVSVFRCACVGHAFDADKRVFFLRIGIPFFFVSVRMRYSCVCHAFVEVQAQKI